MLQPRYPPLTAIWFVENVTISIPSVNCNLVCGRRYNSHFLFSLQFGLRDMDRPSMMWPVIRFVCNIAYRCSLLRFLSSGSYLSRCLAALEQASDSLLSNTY